jgi:hypothetical protein
LGRPSSVEAQYPLLLLSRLRSVVTLVAAVEGVADDDGLVPVGT